jgi:hypothetical protein
VKHSGAHLHGQLECAGHPRRQVKEPRVQKQHLASSIPPVARTALMRPADGMSDRAKSGWGRAPEQPGAMDT